MRVTLGHEAGEPAGTLDWTYELPPDGEGSEGLEGYAVEASTGRRVGSVFLVLQHGDGRYLVVRGAPPRRRLAVVPWEDVAHIDHAADVVTLLLSEAQLPGLPRLAHGKGVHGRDADALRLTDRIRLGPEGKAAGRNRADGRVLGALGLGALGLLTLLATIAVASDPGWRAADFALFAFPGLLLAGALALAFGLLPRPPKVRRGAAA